MKRPEDYGYKESLQIPWQAIRAWAEQPDLLSYCRSHNIHTITYIPKGGLIPAAMLVYNLLAQDYHCAIVSPVHSSYALVIDDIIDSGATLRNMFLPPTAHFVAVFARPTAPEYPLRKYSLETPANTWLVFPWEER